MYILLLLTFMLVMAKGKEPLYRMLEIVLFTPLALITILPGALGFYVFYFVIFDRFLQRKKWLLFSLAGVLAPLSCGIATFLVLSLPGIRGYGPINLPEKIKMVLILSVLSGIHGIIGLVMKGFISWYGDIKLKEDLSRKNHETELALVKSQLNPHFLFNTINNIDVLIEKDPAKASLYLNKLSDIMRFMLYETKTELIPLSRELAYIEQYISLQKIRTANAGYVNYTIEGEAAGHMVAPLLFIPYIENAFKHAERRKNGAAISIQLKIEPRQITFCCENKYQEGASSLNDHKGLGNELLRKRLVLLYPNKHTLETRNENGSYQVTLQLQTHEN
jgi:two-component system LytT family sensor kinase